MTPRAPTAPLRDRECRSAPSRRSELSTATAAKQVSWPETGATCSSPAARPAARSGRPSPRPLSPGPWFRSRAGTLTRPAPASVAHLHSKIAGLSAEIARDALLASSVHLLLAGRLRPRANGRVLDRVAEGSKQPPKGPPIAPRVAACTQTQPRCDRASRGRSGFRYRTIWAAPQPRSTAPLV